MKRFSCLMVLILLLQSCHQYEITEYYYADLSIKNSSSGTVTDLRIDAYYYTDFIYDDGRLSYTYTYTYEDLSAGEQSLSQEVVSGFYFNTNVSSSHYIETLQVSYTSDGVSHTITVFDDGYSSYSSYGNLSIDDLEKVYLLRNSNNTLVISDEGVELIFQNWVIP